MEPTRDDDDALVDLVDVLLREGVLVQADVVVSVAEVPLVGISLRAAVAGMTEMTDRGLLDGWDRDLRRRARARAGAGDRGPGPDLDPGQGTIGSESPRRDGDDADHADEGSTIAPPSRARSPDDREGNRTADGGGGRADGPDS